MFTFAETTKDMTAVEILNYYRNLYYAEPQVTERGIVANAINDFFADVVPKSEVERWRRNLEAVLEERAEEKAELAREIFEEIEKHGRKMQSSDFSGDFWDTAVLMSDIAELKKKYTEGNND
jgi:hypothetical protein